MRKILIIFCVGILFCNITSCDQTEVVDKEIEVKKISAEDCNNNDLAVLENKNVTVDDIESEIQRQADENNLDVLNRTTRTIFYPQPLYYAPPIYYGGFRRRRFGGGFYGRRGFFRRRRRFGFYG